MKRNTFFPSALIGLALLCAASAAVAQTPETSVTGAAGGVYPTNTVFNGVPIRGLEVGYGVSVATPTRGQLSVVLLGVPVGEVQQRIAIAGQATAGQRFAPTVAAFSGTVTIDMGNGTPPLLGVPFTATVTTDTNGRGTLGLVIGANNLPTVPINEGSQTVE